MFTERPEPVSERIADARDAVKHAWTGARERGSDALETAREVTDTVRHKVGEAGDALADQLEHAAVALRRHGNLGTVSRLARERPVPTIAAAFAAGALVGALAGLLLSSMREDSQ